MARTKKATENKGKNECVSVNRGYKARIFEMVFSEKAALLELYNAVNGTYYSDPNELEINTLSNAVYMSMKNDVSCIVDSRLALYEHQSTYCPNLPLRYLMYIADLYSNITKDANFYGTKVIRIPTPKFVVFYNGSAELPDKQILRLSDAFSVYEPELSLELQAVMLNINPGHNEKLLAASKTLRDYSEYTYRVRTHAKTMTIEAAVDKAITECIREGILAEFLKKNRSEAKKMSIYEYDEQKHMQQEREASWQDGWSEGYCNGLQEGENRVLFNQVEKKLQKGLSVEEIAEALEESIDSIKLLIRSLEHEKGAD